MIMTQLTLQVRFYGICYMQCLTHVRRSKKRLLRAGKSEASSQPFEGERAMSQAAGQGQPGSKRCYCEFCYQIQREGKDKSIRNRNTGL